MSMPGSTLPIISEPLGAWPECPQCPQAPSRVRFLGPERGPWEGDRSVQGRTRVQEDHSFHLQNTCLSGEHELSGDRTTELQ